MGQKNLHISFPPICFSFYSISVDPFLYLTPYNLNFLFMNIVSSYSISGFSLRSLHADRSNYTTMDISNESCKKFHIYIYFDMYTKEVFEIYEIQTLSDIIQAQEQILCLHCFHVMILISSIQNVVWVEGNMIFFFRHV